jgi:hypothetical protein
MHRHYYRQINKMRLLMLIGHLFFSMNTSLHSFNIELVKFPDLLLIGGRRKGRGYSWGFKEGLTNCLNFLS